MTYRLISTRRAVRDIERLDPKTKDRIGKTLMRYEKDPVRHAERLTQSDLGSYRFRIGDYEGQEIVVLRVGHRREIYKR